MAFLKGLIQSINSLDILRRPLTFKTKYDVKDGTLAGGLISLFIIGLCSFFFIYLMLNQIEKGYFDNYKLQKQIQNSSIIDANSLKLGVIVSFSSFQEYAFNSQLDQSVFEKYIDLKLFNDELSISSTGGSVQESIEIPMTQCTKEYIEKNMLQNTMNQSSIIYCPKNNFVISSQSKNKNSYQTLRLQVKTRNNQTDYIELMTIQLLFLEQPSLISDSQIKLKLNKADYQLQKEVYQSYQLELLPFSYCFADSFLFQIEFEKQKCNYANQGIELIGSIKRNYNNQTNAIQQKLLDIIFNINDKEHLYTVKGNSFFVNIIIIISQVGGLYHILFIFLAFFYKYYYNHTVYESLMNNIFSFDLGQQQQQQQQENKSENEVQVQRKRKDNPFMNTVSYQVEYTFKQYLKYKLKKLFYGITCRKNKFQIEKGISIFQNAKAKIQQDLDLNHILKRFYEIDKLKLLLMHDEQLILFNSLVNPIIEIDEEIKQYNNVNTMAAQQNQKKDNNNNNEKNGNTNQQQQQKIRNSIKHSTTINNQTPIKIELENVKKLTVNSNQNETTHLIQIDQLKSKKKKPKIQLRSNFFKSEIQKSNGFDICMAYQKIIDEAQMKSTQYSDANDFKLSLQRGLSIKLLDLLKLNKNLFRIINFQNQVMHIGMKRNSGNKAQSMRQKVSFLQTDTFMEKATYNDLKYYSQSSQIEKEDEQIQQNQQSNDQISSPQTSPNKLRKKKLSLVVANEDEEEQEQNSQNENASNQPSIINQKSYIKKTNLTIDIQNIPSSSNYNKTQQKIQLLTLPNNSIEYNENESYVMQEVIPEECNLQKSRFIINQDRIFKKMPNNQQDQIIFN